MEMILILLALAIGFVVPVAALAFPRFGHWWMMLLAAFVALVIVGLVSMIVIYLALEEWIPACQGNTCDYLSYCGPTWCLGVPFWGGIGIGLIAASVVAHRMHRAFLARHPKSTIPSTPHQRWRVPD